MSYPFSPIDLSSQSITETFVITTFADQLGSSSDTLAITLFDLADMLRLDFPANPLVKYWIPGVIQPDALLTHSSLFTISLLVLDVEATPPVDTAVLGASPPNFDTIVAKLDGLACIIHTTYSHQPLSPCYRLIFALSRPILLDELKVGLRQIGQPLVDQLGLGEYVDFARHTPDRRYFLPRYPAERQDDFQQAVIEGRSLNVDVLLGNINHETTTLSCDIRRGGEDKSEHDAQESEMPPGFPKGFRRTQDGIEEETKKGFVRICGDLAVTALTRGAQGDWGRMLVFVDHDGQTQHLAITNTSLHDKPTILATRLANLGFDIVPGKTICVMRFIAGWKTDKRTLSSKRLGWLENEVGEISFVLPDRVITQDRTKGVIYQPEWDSSSIRAIQTSGTLDDWKQHIATKACAHEWMLFALCVGLASVILAFCGASDSFILHFWGRTTRGKTALLQLIASLFGCAFDPTDAPSRSFIRRWNMTINALEGLAEAHSDLPLVLDELGAATNDIRPMVYQLSGGEGKIRMNTQQKMQQPRVWRTIAVSSGELSLHDRMSDPSGNGKRTQVVKGGLTHRALDLEVNDIAETLPETERSSFVAGMKHGCAQYYGTAGPEFIRLIIERFGTGDKVRTYVNKQLDEIKTDITPSGLQLLPEHTRAIRRLAQIAVAGELAVAEGLFPRDAKVRDATRHMVANWLASSVTLTAEEQIIANVRRYIIGKQASFQDHMDKTPRSYCAGWVDDKNDRWLLTEEHLCQTNPGVEKKQIADALKSRGFLFMNNGKDRSTAKVTIASLNNRIPVYAVKGDILGEKESADQTQTPGQPGQPGPDQQPQGAEPVSDAA